MTLETSLYAAVKAFLEAQGFTAKGEIGGCDIVAIRGGEPARVVIVELKLGLNLELLLQGVDRMAAADEVWLAVPATRPGRDRDRRVVRLCRLLGLGLLAVSGPASRCWPNRSRIVPGPTRSVAQGCSASTRRDGATRCWAARPGSST